MKKNRLEKIVLIGFFVSIFLCGVFLRSSVQWLKYVNNTKIYSKKVERDISYDAIPNPNPNKRYFEKIEIVTTIRAKSFPFVERNVVENYKGSFMCDK